MHCLMYDNLRQITAICVRQHTRRSIEFDDCNLVFDGDEQGLVGVRGHAARLAELEYPDVRKSKDLAGYIR